MMFRKSLFTIALMTLLVSAPAARGAEVIFALEQAIGGNSNLVQGTFQRVPDGFYEIAPTIQALENREELNYNFFYRPRYQAFFVTEGINGWAHDFRGRLDYRPSPRDTISLHSTARLDRYISNETTSGITGPSVVAPGVGDVGIYRVDLDYSHGFTDRISGVVGAGYEQFTYENPFNTPNIAGHGSMSAYYQVDERIQLGSDFQGTYRGFEETGGRPASSTTVGNLNFIASWLAQPTFRINASGGPAFVSQRQDDPKPREVFVYNFAGTANGPVAAPWVRGAGIPGSNCPFVGSLQPLNACDLTQADLATGLGQSILDTTFLTFAPGSVTTSVDSDFWTFFATINLSKQWLPNLSTRLGYRRSQDASGGLNTTRISDSVTADVRYEPIEYTTIAVSIAFTNRTSNARVTQGIVTARGSLTDTTDNGDQLAEAFELWGTQFNRLEENLQIYLQAEVQRRLTENLLISATFNYVDQWTDTRLSDFSSDPGGAPAFSNSRFTRFIGRLMVRYEFDPYRF